MDTTRDDVDARIPVGNVNSEGAGRVERTGHDLNHVPYRSWCFSLRGRTPPPSPLSPAPPSTAKLMGTLGLG